MTPSVFKLKNLIAYERGEISLWDFILTEKALFLVFGVIIALDIVVLITVWPYVCVRGCCRSKFPFLRPVFHLTISLLSSLPSLQEVQYAHRLSES